MLKGKAVFLSC